MKRLLVCFLALLLAVQFCGCDMLRDYLFDSEFKRDPVTQGGSQAGAETTAPTEPPVDLSLQPEPNDEDMVRVTDYIEDVLVDLRYAGRNNFTGKRIYEFSDVYLRYGTVKKLKKVAEVMEKQGYRLKIWDGFRPTEAQQILWDTYPDPMFVANPETGYSAHSRGNTVDLTLTDRNGKELAMPSDFDEFSTLADREYSDCSQEVRNNVMLLQNAMEEAGFTGYFGEWWHYTDSVKYPISEDFQPLFLQRCYAKCNEFINLRPHPDFEEEGFLQIKKDETFLVLAQQGEFYYVEYKGLFGYVTKGYAVPTGS